MKALTIYYNEEEDWIHVLISQVREDGTHQVIDSSVLPSTGTSPLRLAQDYQKGLDVGEDNVRIYRTDRVLL